MIDTKTLTVTRGTPDLMAYVSPSRLKLWLRCPRAFQLRYVEGIITPSSPSLVIGQVVHRGLELYHRYRKRGITLYPEFVAGHMMNVWAAAVADEGLLFESSEEEIALRAQAVKLVMTYLAQVSPDEAPPAAVEERLEAPLIDPANGEELGINLVGIVDLVLDEREGPVLVDFKTGARSSSRGDVVHELQLSSYAYLLRQVTGQSESALEIRSLIKTKTPKVQTERFGPRRDVHFVRLFSVIRAYLDAVKSGRFHIRPGLECSFCGFCGQMCQGQAA